MRRWGAIGAGLAVSAALAAPGAAHGAVVEVTASSGPAAEEYLEYRASRGESNRVSVRIAGDHVAIRDPGAKRIRLERTPFGACRATSRQRVVCPGLSVFVFLRDGDDRIAFAPGADEPEPADGNPFDFDEEYEDSEGAVEDTTYLDGGSADDRIVGSRFDDAIVPGRGRDKVFARGGPDWIAGEADDADDHLRGGGGADALYTDFGAAEVIDLAGRTLTSPGQSDSIAGFERVHAGGGDDTLRGSDRAEALYGGGGNDTVDGRGGSDLLFGDSPDTSEGRSSPNTIVGGDGDDFIDARSRNLVPTTPIDCGAGADVFTGEVDDRPEPSCERVAFRSGEGETYYEDPPEFDHSMLAFPVAREPDGDPVYAIPCPPANRPSNNGCSGNIELTSPADAKISYGNAVFGGGPGETSNVPVTLNGAGKAAVAAGEPVAVRIVGFLAAPGGSKVAGGFTFGWQHVMGP